MISQRPTRALIDLAAIRHNVGIVRACVGPVCRIAAVVKADGYGHGAAEAALAALDAGAQMLCVAIPREGIELRERFPDVPILVFGPLFPAEAEGVVLHGLTQTVEDEDILQHLSAAARRCGREAVVHVNIDTGMGRIGVQPKEAVRFMQRAAGYDGLRFEGICSHFAASDDENLTFAGVQLSAFRDMVDELAQAGFRFKLRHMANSAAVLALPESHMDMVRPGIMLYGLRPAPHLGEDLAPAMTVLSRITKLKDVPPGTPISYGSTWRSPDRRRIATVPMGYADGYRRGLSNRFHVLVRGRPAFVVGRVCMDMFMVDVTEIEGVQRGDEVLIFGRSGPHYLPAEDMAEALDTIPYEVVTGISRRVPRVYGEDGARSAVSSQ